MVIRVVRPRRYALTAALCVALCGLSLRSQVGSAQVQSVTVTGRGATRYDAREDAIRQALQQTVQQLVTVDRVIENEQIALDKIASTMNGYVTKFDEQRVTTTADGRVSMEAIVEVSPTRIQNFLSSTSGTRVQTGDVVADAQRELLARRARVEVLAGLFSPFPSGALILSKHAISPHAERPEFLQLVTTVQVAPPFIARLKAGMRSLGARQASGPDPGHYAQDEFQRPNTFTLCFEEDHEDDKDNSYIDSLPRGFLGRKALADCLTLTPVDVPLLTQMLVGMRESNSYYDTESHAVLDLIVGIETPEGVQRIEVLSTTVRPRIFDRRQNEHLRDGLWMLFNISKARHTVGVLIPLVTLANSPAGATVVSFPVVQNVTNGKNLVRGKTGQLERVAPDLVIRSILRGGIEGPPISKEFINGLARSFVAQAETLAAPTQSQPTEAASPIPTSTSNPNTAPTGNALIAKLPGVQGGQLGVAVADFSSVIFPAGTGLPGSNGADPTGNEYLFEMFQEDPRGAFINEVTSNGAAAVAGIKRGDVIMGVQGPGGLAEVKNVADMTAILATMRPGMTVRVLIRRVGEGGLQGANVVLD